jgi:hypothetical protein
MWFWGLLGLVALMAWRRAQSSRIALFGVGWIAITFLPYSFLTYMPHVPSRHTYLASVGLAWVVASGLLLFYHQIRAPGRWPAYALAALMLVHNCGYVWVKKRAQYLERAVPTEALVEVARHADGPVYVRCFPYDRDIAELAVQLRLGKPASSLVWAKTGSQFTPGCLEKQPLPPLRAARGGAPVQSND